MYYCDQKCQKIHWPGHRRECKPPAVDIEEHIVIAVPDFQCFWRYQSAQSELAASAAFVGVLVVNRSVFEEMFGVEAAGRTIHDLAVFGKPSPYITKTCSLPQAEDPR